MFGRIAYQRLNVAHQFAKVFAMAAGVGISAFIFIVINVNNVDVAGYVQFPCAQFTHAHDTKFAARTEFGDGFIGGNL